jgi:hopanoid-associated phosphorylase
MHNQSFVLLGSGLNFEARIALKIKDARVCCGQGRGIKQALAKAIGANCLGILSFGIVGGLDPRLRAGTVIIATSVIGSNARFPTDPTWSQSLSQLFPNAVRSPILSAQEAIVDPDAKRRLFRASGAAVVDMESDIAANLAAVNNLPFAALRVVADPAHRRIPPSALCGVRLDGRLDPLAVIRALIWRPRDAFNVAALAWDAWVAKAVLCSAARQLERSLNADWAHCAANSRIFHADWNDWNSRLSRRNFMPDQIV